MPPQQSTVDAHEAARLLGISVPTLYAYVSRGMIRSEEGEGASRARRYRLDDLEALQKRKEYRREPAKAAESALRFGMPVLDSALTLIEDGKFYYRGYDACTLAQERTFEEVAALLWTGEFSMPGGIVSDFSLMDLLPTSRELPSPLEAYQTMLAGVAPHDLAAYQIDAAAVARTGLRILHLLTFHTVGRMPEHTMARALQQTWAPDDIHAERMLTAALVLCADHELNVSTFTARCVASAGSSPYAVVIAALSALQGHKHGGQTSLVAGLLDAARHGVRPAIADHLKRAASIPGFGHPLYPEGDPRARLLLAMLNEHYPRHRTCCWQVNCVPPFTKN
ncbi:MAG: citrate synthase [Anaerolineales bacterium]|nr:citrate synthase [Anaerolineales bacterium]